MEPGSLLSYLQEPAIGTYLELDQFSQRPHPTAYGFILIRRLFPSGFPTKTVYGPLLFPIRATCSTHIFLLDLLTGTLRGVRIVLDP
jgi:hypothetical protein